MGRKARLALGEDLKESLQAAAGHEALLSPSVNAFIETRFPPVFE